MEKQRSGRIQIKHEGPVNFTKASDKSKSGQMVIEGKQIQVNH